MRQIVQPILDIIENKRNTNAFPWPMLVSFKDFLWSIYRQGFPFENYLKSILKPLTVFSEGIKNKELMYEEIKSIQKNSYSISFCTTCMNRLSHLKKTLPKNLKDNASYEKLQFVILDYSSEEKIENWIIKKFPNEFKNGRIKIIREDSNKYFHMARAKNIAHSFADGDIVCNIDADNYTGKYFAYYLNYIANRNDSFIAARKSIGYDLKKFRKTHDPLGLYDIGAGGGGRIALFKKDFIKLGGYNEFFSNWGQDDNELFLRSLKYNLTYEIIPKSFFKIIKHSDHSRSKNLSIKHLKKMDKIYEWKMRINLKRNILCLKNNFEYENVKIINPIKENTFINQNFKNRNLVLILCKESWTYPIRLKNFLENKGLTVKIIEDLNINYEDIDQQMISEGFFNFTRNRDYIKTPSAWDKCFFYLKDVINDFDYVYFIEDDVYSNDLGTFYNFIKASDNFKWDLLARKIQKKEDSLNWFHWKYENVEKYKIPACAFTALCRLSKNLIIKVLEQRENFNKFDYHEIMFSSIAFSEGLSIEDFQEHKILSKYFIDVTYRHDFSLKEIESNKILHPVKRDILEKIENHTNNKDFKNAYLFLAYKHPKVLKECILKLRDSNSIFIVHLDEKADNKYLDDFGLKWNNIFFIEKRVNIKWAGYSMIEATLNLLKFVKENNFNIDYVFLLSDQHYPVLDIKKINGLLNDKKPSGIMEIIEKFNSKFQHQEFLERIRYYWDVDNDNINIPQGNLRIQKKKKVNRLKKIKINFYKGSQWWCIKGGLIDFVFEYIDKNPDFINFMRKSLIPDEMFFQTILMDSPYKDELIKDNFSFIKWNAIKTNKGFEPKVLDLKDYNSIIKSNKIFARKFESEKSFYLMLKLRSKF